MKMYRFHERRLRYLCYYIIYFTAIILFYFLQGFD